MSRKHITEDELQQIKALWDSGKKATQIASEIGRSHPSIYRALDKIGVDRKKSKGRKVLTDAEVSECISLYRDKGLTLEEVGARFGTFASTVRRRMLDAGYTEFNRAGAPARFQGDERRPIVELYESGFSTNFLSAKFKCSPDAINRALDDCGIKRRTHLESVGFRWTDVKGREHLMRSSWEVCTAQWLDDQGLAWDYELKSFVLDDDGKRRRYTPDFWGYGDGGSVEQIIEVKGWMSESCENRIALFRRDYSDLPFEIWEEAELKQRGILDVVVHNPPTRVKFAGSTTRMSNKERLRAMDLFDEGMSYANIAEDLQRSSSTVSSFLKSTGRATTKSESNRGRVPQEERERAAALYLTGDSITTVAEKTGLSRDIVWGEIRRRGISRPRRGSK